MTDKLIERIKETQELGRIRADDEYTRAMEARILADAPIIKAAEELVCLLERAIHNTPDFYTLWHKSANDALAAYRAAVAEGRG